MAIEIKLTKGEVAIISDNLSGKNIRDFNGNTVGNFKIIYKENK